MVDAARINPRNVMSPRWNGQIHPAVIDLQLKNAGRIGKPKREATLKKLPMHINKTVLQRQRPITNYSTTASKA